MSCETFEEKQNDLNECLSALIGAQIDILRLPRRILTSIEPSQVGTIVGGLMDVCIPDLREMLPDHKNLEKVGLSRAPGILGSRLKSGTRT